MTNDVIFKVENLIKYFKVGKQNVEILRGISFEIKKGDFAIIFGPSGSGKSTLLHVILGLEEPSSGSVTFLGEDFYKGRDEDDRAVIRKSHIGMVYQQPN
jgi:putative ABC transport system ATP-binding protein